MTSAEAHLVFALFAGLKPGAPPKFLPLLGKAEAVPFPFLISPAEAGWHFLKLTPAYAGDYDLMLAARPEAEWHPPSAPVAAFQVRFRLSSGSRSHFHFRFRFPPA